MAAFKRPPNQIPGIAGLYAVGGSVHPGAGLPMVALSAKIAAEMALSDLRERR
jgi:phytoene dehydrogenase-like protein